ncbi:hypothetical protein ACEQPO_04540 [Bacillus sp. SL00103]
MGLPLKRTPLGIEIWVFEQVFSANVPYIYIKTNGGQLILLQFVAPLFVPLGAFTLHHLLKKRNRFILVLSHPASDTCDWLQVSHPFYTTDLTSGAKLRVPLSPYDILRLKRWHDFT